MAVEGDWPDCGRVDGSVRVHPAATPTRARTRDVLNAGPPGCGPTPRWSRFCRWLRAWNVERPARLRAGFHGLDVYWLWESMRRSSTSSARGSAGPGGGPERVPLLRAVRRGPAGVRRASRSCRAMRGRGGRLLTVRPGTGAPCGAGRFSAWQNPRRCGRGALLPGDDGGGPQSWNVRDTHMADTLDRLMAQYGPQAKGIVWAHNSHVGDSRATDMAEVGTPQPRPAGTGTLRRAPRCCWSASAATRVRWSRRTTGGRPRRCCRCRRPAPGSVERQLHESLPGPGAAGLRRRSTSRSGQPTASTTGRSAWSTTRSTSRRETLFPRDCRSATTPLSGVTDERAASTAGPRDAGRAGDVPRRHLIAGGRVFAGQELCARLAVYRSAQIWLPLADGDRSRLGDVARRGVRPASSAGPLFIRPHFSTTTRHP